MNKLIITILALLLTITSVTAQQTKSKKKKKKKTKTTTHVSKPTIVKTPLTASDKAHLSNGFFKAVVVDKRGLDGCTFVLKLEDHSTLEPLGLNEQFKIAGKQLWVKFSIAKNAMSVCMSGTPVTITAAEAVE